jgi:hypothetical protein
MHVLYEISLRPAGIRFSEKEVFTELFQYAHQIKLTFLWTIFFKLQLRATKIYFTERPACPGQHPGLYHVHYSFQVKDYFADQLIFSFFFF